MPSDRAAVSHLQWLLFSSPCPGVPGGLSSTTMSLVPAVMEISREYTSCSPAFNCAIFSVQHPVYINLDHIIPSISHFHSLPPCYLGRQQVCHFAFLFFLLISLPFTVRASFARSLLEQHASWDQHLIRLQFPLPWSSVQSARTSQIELGLLPHRQQGHCNPRSS